MTRAAPTTLTPTAGLAEVRELITALADEVDATAQTAGFQAAIEAMVRFWTYSVNNQWLIRAQRPDATRVAGRRVWAQLGRAPRADARPISILAPTRGGFSFMIVAVFDVADTEGAPLPVLDTALTGDTAPVALLEQAAARLGVRLITRPTAAAGLGLVTLGQSHGGEVRIAPGLPRDQRAAVLAHELAHELLHQGSQAAAARSLRASHAERETEAEATAYVVLRALGLPSKAPTYIAWCGGDGAAVMRSMGRVQRAARTILEATAAPRRRRRARQAVAA